jgi:hypothetical protein
MILVERHIISKAHKPWQEIDKLSFLRIYTMLLTTFVVNISLLLVRNIVSLTLST